MLGCYTFLTTLRPSCSVARWICAVEAAAYGFLSNETNTSLSELLSSYSMITLPIQTGMVPALLEAIWPIITQLGPSCCSMMQPIDRFPDAAPFAFDVGTIQPRYGFQHRGQQRHRHTDMLHVTNRG